MGKFEQIIGQGDAIQYVFFRVEQVAPTDSAILILAQTNPRSCAKIPLTHNSLFCIFNAPLSEFLSNDP